MTFMVYCLGETKYVLCLALRFLGVAMWTKYRMMFIAANETNMIYLIITRLLTQSLDRLACIRQAVKLELDTTE